MPISQDPERRARQLQNLRPEPGSDAWRRQMAGLRKGSESSGTARAGDARRLVHGGRSLTPQRSPEWPPAVELAILDLQGRVRAELRDADGNLHPEAVPSVEAVALARVAAGRAERWVSDKEARGTLALEDLAV